MIDFNDIRPASKSEQIRAYSVERAIEFLPIGQPGQDVVNVAKMIEDYINDGDVSGTVQYAVEEGVIEGRFEVKEAVEEWFSNVDLDDLFVTKGWKRNLPEPGTVREY